MTRATPPAAESRELVIPDVEDSREICFQQGKPCVYEPEDERGTIVTEWPNGVIDWKRLDANTRTRHWPDGTVETTAGDAPPTFPHWPRRRT